MCVQHHNVNAINFRALKYEEKRLWSFKRYSDNVEENIFELKKNTSMREGKRQNNKEFFNRIAIGFPRAVILREVMNWKDSG